MHRLSAALLVFSVLLLLAVGGPPLAASSFTYSDFSSIAGLNLVGSAAQVGNYLQLTNDYSQAGAAWYSTLVTVGLGFDTSFTYQIPNPGADGLVFLVQNSASGASALGDGGGGIGYSGIDNSLAVEIDTFRNDWDPSNDHMAIQSCGTASNVAGHTFCNYGLNSPMAAIWDGQPHTVRVAYVPGSFTVYFDGSPVMTSALDLSALLSIPGGQAYVGFTAATGGSWEYNNLLSWSFSSTEQPGGIPEPATFVLIGTGLLLVGFRLRR